MDDNEWIEPKNLSEVVKAYEDRLEVQKFCNERKTWTKHIDFYLGHPTFTRRFKYRYRKLNGG